MNRYMASIAYGRTMYSGLTGNEIPSEYSNSEDGVLSWFSDNIDIDMLYNDVLASDIQITINLWVVEDIDSSEARRRLIDLFADHFGFGC